MVGKTDFDENPVVSLDLDLDFGLRLRVCQYNDIQCNTLNIWQKLSRTVLHCPISKSLLCYIWITLGNLLVKFLSNKGAFSAIWHLTMEQK